MARASDWAWVTKTKVISEVALQDLQLLLNGLAQVGVERAQRLVEQQDVRLRHQAAGQRHTLLLPSRKRSLLRVRHIAEFELLDDAVDPARGSSSVATSRT